MGRGFSLFRVPGSGLWVVGSGFWVRALVSLAVLLRAGVGGWYWGVGADEEWGRFGAGFPSHHGSNSLFPFGVEWREDEIICPVCTITYCELLYGYRYEGGMGLRELGASCE